jgi:hypothetical protein
MLAVQVDLILPCRPARSGPSPQRREIGLLHCADCGRTGRHLMKPAVLGRADWQLASER